ncbi:hypothetical protein NDU88_000864 [Pleurodeles waltl]|uniref:Uncharacterized protein n=1 Tax=Pleurodeles waltl TaxID=8319 RepID=A0AAV7WKP4_PLEWA|nr:hypothetical protein NDU88_000864 [Pleurodeles waltl]
MTQEKGDNERLCVAQGSNEGGEGREKLQALAVFLQQESRSLLKSGSACSLDYQEKAGSVLPSVFMETSERGRATYTI